MNKIFDPRTNIGVFVIVFLAIAVVLFILFVAPEMLAQIGGLATPLAMTMREKPSWKPLIVTIVVFVLLCLLGIPIINWSLSQ